MLKASLYKVDQPMAIPFGHAALKRVHADSIVLILEGGGLRGMGECAPRTYVTGESSDEVLEVAAGIDSARIAARILGTAPREVVRCMFHEGTAAYLGLPAGNNLACLFELAVLDLLARQAKRSVAGLVAEALSWPHPVAERCEIPFTHVLDFSADCAHPGPELTNAHAIKVKVNAELGRTVSLVRAVRAAAGRKPLLIVDANMSWDVATALRHADALSGFDVGLYEEPLARGNLTGAALLRRQAAMPVMLDESLCSLNDAHEAVASGACDAFNIRVAKCGGLLGAIHMVRFAREHRIRYQIGVQVAQVGPLIQAERQLALLCPGFLTMESGQHDRFFDEMVITPVPVIERLRHRIVIGPSTGLGVDPSPFLERFAWQGACHANAQFIQEF